MTVRKIIGLLRGLRGLGERARNEPIVLVGLALAALGAYQEATLGGLGPEDTWIFIADAVLIWVARELVVPTNKVKNDPTITVIEPEPFLHKPVPDVDPA